MEGRLLILISLKTGDLLLVKKAQNKVNDYVSLKHDLAGYPISLILKRLQSR